jgi:CTP synthase (UTP-ammonia lyase)
MKPVHNGMIDEAASPGWTFGPINAPLDETRLGYYRFSREATMDRTIRIGLIGDFKPDYQYHIATTDAIQHSADSLSIDVECTWLPTTKIERELDDSSFQSVDALWCAPGSPYESMEGALKAIQYAREKDIPYLGTCGGFQHTIIEYARNVLGFIGADHEETSPDSDTLFISKLTCSLKGKLGTVTLLKNSYVHDIYKMESIDEQFRCNYGINPKYLNEITKKNLAISGIGPEGEPRIIELHDRRFFVATLFLPQLTSSKGIPHPLINEYLRVASAN